MEYPAGYCYLQQGLHNNASLSIAPAKVMNGLQYLTESIHDKCFGTWLAIALCIPADSNTSAEILVSSPVQSS